MPRGLEARKSASIEARLHLKDSATFQCPYMASYLLYSFIKPRSSVINT